MVYQINKYNRTFLVNVQDGNTDSTSTSLTFVGKNFSGYGGLQNENFLYLLENFANSSPPTNPIIGQVWYDSANRKLRFYDTTYGGGSTENTFAKWRPVGAEIGSTQPTGMTVGDFWFDTSTNQLKAYVGGTNPFRLIGPQAVYAAAQTNLESVSVKDTSTTSRPIVKAVINGSTVFVISKEEFTLADDEALKSEGFSTIKQGLTLVYTTDGHTTNNSYRFWGTASDSDRLGNSLAADYVKKQDATFTNLATFANAGLTINSIIKLSVTDSLATIENISSKTLSFKIKDGTETRNPLILDGLNVVPGLTTTFNLGTNDKKWNNFYAKTVNAETLTVSGSLTATSDRADTIFFSLANSGQGGYVSTSSSNVPYTIVARDGSGNFAANVITATVTQARYADLAEKYDADADYEPGTVVVFGGEKEITVTDLEEDARVAGVISTNPAYVMNSESNGLAVALRGKVPCKVVGPVQKGDILVSASTPGYAKAGNTASLPATIIGKSLENKVDEDFGVIMIVVT